MKTDKKNKKLKAGILGVLLGTSLLMPIVPFAMFDPIDKKAVIRLENANAAEATIKEIENNSNIKPTTQQIFKADATVANDHGYAPAKEAKVTEATDAPPEEAKLYL